MVRPKALLCHLDGIMWLASGYDFEVKFRHSHNRHDLVKKISGQ